VLFGDGDISAVPAVPVQMGETVIGALVSTGLANSKSAARQLIAGGGVYLDGSTVSADRQFSESERGRRKLQVGKKHVRIIHIS
jgi:tyrosyl-tRNA synthetase